MSTAKDMRMERINRLLHELRYELERGFMEGEIEDEMLSYQFIVPVSREINNGVVQCVFRTRPVHRDSILGMDFCLPPKLKVIK